MAYIIRIDDGCGDAARFRKLAAELDRYCSDSRWAEMAPGGIDGDAGRIDINVRGTSRFAKVRKEIEGIVAHYDGAAVSVHRQVME